MIQKYFYLLIFLYSLIIVNLRPHKKWGDVLLHNLHRKRTGPVWKHKLSWNCNSTNNMSNINEIINEIWKIWIFFKNTIILGTNMVTTFSFILPFELLNTKWPFKNKDLSRDSPKNTKTMWNRNGWNRTEEWRTLKVLQKCEYYNL